MQGRTTFSFRLGILALTRLMRSHRGTSIAGGEREFGPLPQICSLEIGERLVLNRQQRSSVCYMVGELSWRTR